MHTHTVNCDWNDVFVMLEAVYDTENSSVFTRTSTLSTSIITFFASLQSTHNGRKQTLYTESHKKHTLTKYQNNTLKCEIAIYAQTETLEKECGTIC